MLLVYELPVQEILPVDELLSRELQTLAAEPERCVAVIDSDLPLGNAANAAAVMALTIGARHPHLVGEAVIDAAGNEHLGLVLIGIPILGAPKGDLPGIRRKALEADIEVVDFPVQGQQTTNYAEFRQMMSSTQPESLAYLGVMLFGTKKKVSRIVGKYSLLRRP
jgi:hypothetical protein